VAHRGENQWKHVPNIAAGVHKGVGPENPGFQSEIHRAAEGYDVHPENGRGNEKTDVEIGWSEIELINSITDLCYYTFVRYMIALEVVDQNACVVLEFDVLESVLLLILWWIWKSLAVINPVARDDLEHNRATLMFWQNFDL
jgi:hypothetical protein